MQKIWKGSQTYSHHCIHTAHEIMTQDVYSLVNACGGTIPDIPLITKSGKHSIKYIKLKIYKVAMSHVAGAQALGSPGGNVQTSEEAMQEANQFNLSWVFITLLSRSSCIYWTCFNSSSLLHQRGSVMYFQWHLPWYCASQEKKSNPFIRTRSLSTIFITAVSLIVYSPSNLNLEVASVAHILLSFVFLLPSLLQNMHSGLHIWLAPPVEDVFELPDELDGSGFNLVDLANLFRFIIKHW